MRLGWVALAILALWALFCLAVQTRTWIQSDYADFEKGIVKNLSLRSDGGLTLAPRFQERFDSSSAYLWALAQDSKGNLYTGGGPGAKIYRVPAHGEARTLAELEALEIHGIAVDHKDRIFVATSPDGKVYKLSQSGKSELFYDPHTKYIWAMAFNSQGDLLIATGDPGEIHRVSPDGKGGALFKTDEMHARSMAIDSHDDIIVGTEPGGLVLRISPTGAGFVLYQAPKKEVTAVAVAGDGSIYAAAVGAKQAAAPLPPAPVPAAPAPAPPPGTITLQRPAAPPPMTLAPSSSSITGGTELYRIEPDGYPHKIWSHPQDIVYAIGFDANGAVLLGAGNKGSIYRLEGDNRYTALLSAPPTQVTCFLLAAQGALYAATGNVGKVYQIGPGLESQGYIESEVFDAGIFSRWGRLDFKGCANDGQIALATRSGNLDRPEKNWSDWSPAITSGEGARVTSPPARFLQWRATLSLKGTGKPPELDSVEVAYLPKNAPPRIEELEITPPNYRFPPATTITSNSPPSLSLPPIGKPGRASTPAASLDSTPAMQYAKGYIGARWSAADDNGDTLTYTLEIRGTKETQWKLLKDNIKEKYYSWDSSAFPDGEYQLRLTASDLPSNTKENALTAQRESEPFLIDNAPPRIVGLTASQQGGKLNIRWKAVDALSVIKSAEYSLDGGDWTTVTPTTHLSDSPELEYNLTIDGISPGEHTIAVRAEDKYDNQAADKVVVR